MDIRTHLKWNAPKNPELLNEASHVQIILSWISFSQKVVSVKMSLLQMLLRQEEDTICVRELPAENPDRDHLDEDDNNCRADVIYILHASMSATVNFSIGLKFNFNRDVV